MAATTKTLTPTNQTISIPAFTDKPDNRLQTDSTSKLADAVNALNSKIENYVKIKTVTRTTDATGLCNIDLGGGSSTSNKYAVVDVVDDDDTKSYIYMPFKYTGVWHVRVISSTSGNVIASTSVSMKVHYIELS